MARGRSEASSEGQYEKPGTVYIRTCLYCTCGLYGTARPAVYLGRRWPVSSRPGMRGSLAVRWLPGAKGRLYGCLRLSTGLPRCLPPVSIVAPWSWPGTGLLRCHEPTRDDIPIEYRKQLAALQTGHRAWLSGHPRPTDLAPGVP